MLSDVPPGQHFNIHMGSSIRNIRELAEAIDIMDERSFKHHMRDDKNDFATWVKDVIGDFELAAEMQRINTREGLVNAIKRRILDLAEAESSGPAKEIAVQETAAASKAEAQGASQEAAAKWHAERHHRRMEFLVGIIIGVVIGILLKMLI
ncbi:hypothetical protein COT48_06245 [Candidatus Woesearchaeota archaeon CG08_land_8_20_14_0_20_47_9]|nr:MAG: hypothetical protein AUJ69_00725 [Candidatus Woesearchaeota archaeon CG1_02_47_18]PIN72059.1 MAG: hypothetical protein COV22_04170 [Candidatus Woesearchaeota archaeon CG10_big_fil_rev_8_21_14_0_10_47_5]PIO03087.1 MAG: hypothetical protein COT48_06245 [Candidatus Woesearchaeota archaeon CG08_land_8_20_14_0_20_47_9]